MDNLSIALSKGRLANAALAKFAEVGLTFSDYSPESRKLIFTCPQSRVRVVLIKAEDVTTYVEMGAADIGVVGKDSLLEKQADVYEVQDLGFGRCKFAVAALKGNKFEKQSVRVATKYPKVARDYYASRGISAEIICLGGSVELAPLMGLADVIVDLVETGTTLRENDLEIVEDICQISARLIVNKISFKAKSARIRKLMQDLKDCQKGGQACRSLI